MQDEYYLSCNREVVHWFFDLRRCWQFSYRENQKIGISRAPTPVEIKASAELLGIKKMSKKYGDLQLMLSAVYQEVHDE